MPKRRTQPQASAPAATAATPGTAIQPVPGGWGGRFDRLEKEETMAGWPIYFKRQPLTEEIAHGRLRNHVLNETINDAEWFYIEADDTEEAMRRFNQEKYEDYLRICVRAMVSPKLIVPEWHKRQPRYDHDECGPNDLHFIEVSNVAWRATKEVVPPPSAAPFPAADRSDSAASVAPAGDGVSHDAE